MFIKRAFKYDSVVEIRKAITVQNFADGDSYQAH